MGLAGTLRSYRLRTHSDTLVALENIAYAGQSAGYASQPGEVVNYVENHDNQTLFDNHVFKLPLGTPREDRARVQVLALATTTFSQGVAYFHAGVELLRSKSLDRNSYNSGDWFNRLDWRAQDNGFGGGLHPRRFFRPSENSRQHAAVQAAQRRGRASTAAPSQHRQPTGTHGRCRPARRPRPSRRGF